MAAPLTHSYKADKERRSKPGADKSLLYWTALLLIGIFLFVCLFQTALFYGYTVQYEYALNSAAFWAGIMLVVLGIYYAYNWKISEVSDLLALWIWSIPAAYMIATVQAVSSHYASSMVTLNTMYSIFFVLAVAFAKNKLGARLIQYGIVFAGYTAVFYCFMNMFGNAYYQDAVMMTDMGLRLTSIFQYANAYAAYLMAILLAALWLLVHERRWYVVGIHAVAIVPLFVSFLLTLSRGGLVVLPFIVLAILPFFRFTQQIYFFVYAMIGAVGALLVFEPISNITVSMFNKVTAGGTLQPALVGPFDSESLKGWLIIGSTSLLAGALITIFQQFVVPKLEQRDFAVTKRRLANLFIPGVLVLIGLVGVILISGNSFITKLLPTELQTRLLSINFQQHSVLERLTMYKDSMKLVSDYPITGAGGGAWTILYQKYQNNPYIVKQVHNFFLQYWVETGLLGLLALLILLISVYYLYIRQFFKQPIEERGRYQVFYIFSVAILIHSMLDFEMSYAYLAAVVFLCLGGMAASITMPLAIKEGGGVRSWIRKINQSKIRFIYPLLIGVIAIMMIVTGIRELNGNRQYMVAATNLQAPGEIILADVMQPLDGALRASPNHPDYITLRVNLLYQAFNQSKDILYSQEAKTYFDKLALTEPYNKERLEMEYNQFVTEGKLNEALAVTEKTLSINSWGINVQQGGPNWYDRAIFLYYELGERARVANNPALNTQYWNRAMETYNLVAAKKESLKNLPKGQMQGEPFDITPGMSLSMGKLYATSKDFKVAADLLRVNIASTAAPETTRMIVRWYLAALQKQGQNDQPTYDAFVAKYPEEKAEITKLVATF